MRGMASRPRTPEAGCGARHPSRADRLPDRGSRYFRYGPLDRKLVDVPDADVALDHRMECLAEQRETGICTTNCVTATETCDCFMKDRVTCFWSTNRVDLATLLLSDLASRRCPCASLSLHLHQVVKRTFTSRL